MHVLIKCKVEVVWIFPKEGSSQTIEILTYEIQR